MLRCLIAAMICCVLGMAPGAARSSSLAAHKAPVLTGLQTKIAHIAQVTHGPVGVTLLGVESGKSLAWNGECRLPMQSVYKIPIAMVVLNQVDHRKLAISQQVRIKPEDLAPPSVHSPLAKQYPQGTVMTVSDLLRAMIETSDGTASDVLLKLVGGPVQVTAYIRRLGIQHIRVATSEKEMAQNEQVQYRNGATTDAMAGLLRTLQQGMALSASSRVRLLHLMMHSKTGIPPLQKLLPAGTVVAHKSGASGTTDGLTRATNDAGIVTLPDGRHLIIVVFLSDTRASAAARSAVIAQIARAAWDDRRELE